MKIGEKKFGLLGNVLSVLLNFMVGGFMRLVGVNRLAQIVAVLVSIWTAPVFAQLDPLTERGIDPEFLTALASSSSQPYKFQMRIKQANIRADGSRQVFSDSWVVFDPFTDYGIDMSMRFDTRKLAELQASDALDADNDTVLLLDMNDAVATDSAADNKKFLSNLMRVQNRLKRAGRLYDPETILVESETATETVIRFRFRMDALPQEIAYLRFLGGRVFLKNNEVQRVELLNDRPYRLKDVNIREFRKVVTFVKDPYGNYLIDRYELSVKGTKVGLFSSDRGEPVETYQSAKFIQYRDQDNNVIYLSPDATPRDLASLDLDNENFEEVRVKIARTFPLWGSEVRKLGFDLPSPFGISGLYRQQSNTMRFTGFKLNDSNAAEALFDPGGSGLDVDTRVTAVRADWFILPFLNVSGIIGKNKSDAILTVRTTDELRGFLSLIGIDNVPEYISAPLKVEGTTASIALTTAVGYKNFFGSVNVAYAKTFTAAADTESESYILIPVFGYQFLDSRSQLLFGAEYQKLTEQMAGTIQLPDGPLKFNIGLESSEWAGLVGYRKEIGRHWDATVMGSLGEDRKAISLMAGYRF